MTLCRKDRLVELSPWSLQSFWPCSSIVPWRTWAKICEVWKLGSGVWHWFSNELAKCWEQMQCAWKISQPFWLTVQPRRSGRILLCWDFAQHHGAWTEGEVLGRPGADVAATHDALNELLQGWYQHRPEVAHLSRHYFSSHAVLGGAAFYLEHATADDFPDLCLGWINHWITENIWRLSQTLHQSSPPVSLKIRKMQLKHLFEPTHGALSSFLWPDSNSISLVWLASSKSRTFLTHHKCRCRWTQSTPLVTLRSDCQTVRLSQTVFVVLQISPDQSIVLGLPSGLQFWFGSQWISMDLNGL